MGGFNTPTSDVDAWRQPVHLLRPDGSNFTVNMEDFNAFRCYTARLAINYGSQVGASALLLLVLLLLTRAEKRKSAIFIINALCLVTNTIRCVLLSLYLTGTLWNPYSHAVGNWSRVTQGDIAATTTANVFTMLVMVLIMISLTLQVWVVCVTTMPIQRYFIMGITTAMACAATGYKFAFVIIVIRQLNKRETMDHFLQLTGTSYVLQAISIWLFSCVFTYKLGYAIYQRRRLNMTQFGPMQIIFIGGCQTMLVPAIFSLGHFREDVPELGVQVLTVVCIFLPLSAIWAGIVNETVPASSGPDAHHRLIQGEFYRTSKRSTVGTIGSSDSTEKSRELSVCTCSTGTKGLESAASTPSPRKSVHGLYRDDAIHVGREFGYTRENASTQV